MAHQSPFDERIFKEWDGLCFSTNPDMAPEEREHRAKALHASCVDHGKWTVSVDNAELASFHAVLSALQGRRFDEAIAFCRQFLAHEGLRTNKTGYRDEYLTLLGTAQILLGDTRDGLGQFSEVLRSGEWPVLSRKHPIRNKLI